MYEKRKRVECNDHKKSVVISFGMLEDSVARRECQEKFAWTMATRDSIKMQKDKSP